MNEELGIESIETIVAFLCGVGVDVEASIADGKFTVTDLARFLDDAMKIPAVVRALPQVDDEFIDLTIDEENVIVESVKAKLKLPDADVTEVVAAAIAAMLSTSATIAKVNILVEKIKALKHPELV